MKKLSIAVLALVVVLGVSQITAMGITGGSSMKSESITAVKRLQSVETGKVKAMTAKRFHQNFGSVSNVVWEKSKSFDKVSFTKDGYKMVAYYNNNSKLVGTSSTELPGQALADLKNQYKDYTIGSVIFFDQNEANAISKLVYGTQLKEETYLVELTRDQKSIVVSVKLKGGAAVINQI